MFHTVSRSSRRRTLAIALIASSMTPILVSADFPEPIHRTAKVWGVGWGDGYHACSSSGCRFLADLPPRSFAASDVSPAASRRCPDQTCATMSSANLGQHRGDTFYDRFDAQAHAYDMAQRARMMMMQPRPIQPLVDPEAGIYPTTAWPNYRMPVDNQLPTVAMPIMPAKVNPSNNEPANAPELTPEELEDFRTYQEHKRLKEKYDKYLIDPEEFDPSQEWGGPPAGSDERRKMDEQRAKQPSPPRPRMQLQTDDEPRSPSDIGMPVEQNTHDEEPVPLEMILPPFPTNLDEPSGLQEPAGPSSLPALEQTKTAPIRFNAPKVESRPADTLGRRYIQQPTPRVAEIPQRQFVKQPERR